MATREAGAELRERERGNKGEQRVEETGDKGSTSKRGMAENGRKGD